MKDSVRASVEEATRIRQTIHESHEQAAKLAKSLANLLGELNEYKWDHFDQHLMEIEGYLAKLTAEIKDLTGLVRDG
jgi:DNA repair exonuclease SbcCD ATPase subunit